MSPESMIPVKDKSGRVCKYFSSGENLFADVYISDPSNPECRWEIELVNSYNAHQPDFVPNWKRKYPKAKRVMRIFKNDVIALDTLEGKREYRRLRKMTWNILYLRPIYIAKKDDALGEQFSANQLMLKRARKAGIDITGRYFDPITNEQHP